MQNESIGNYIKRLIKQSGILGSLIAVNTVVFLVFLVFDIVGKLGSNPLLGESIKQYFVAPGTLAELLYKPWTIVTHMFVHANFGHFLFNMIFLFFAGRIFIYFFGQRRLLFTYLLGSIFAYIVHLLVYNTVPAFVAQGSIGILGASASVMAIFIGAAVHQPGYILNLFGVFRVPLILIAGLYVIGDLVGISQPASQVAHVAHIGGALFGGLSVINAHSSGNMMNRLDRLILRMKSGVKLNRSKSKMKVYQDNRAAAARMTDDEYNAAKVAKQKRIDAILEKISKKGYDSLTKEEKQILFDESKQ